MDALRYIRDLCIGYDGFDTVDSLKELIDEIRDIAERELANHPELPDSWGEL